MEGETERVELVEVDTELGTDTEVGTGRLLLELAEMGVSDTEACGVAVVLVATCGGTILAVSFKSGISTRLTTRLKTTY